MCVCLCNIHFQIQDQYYLVFTSVSGSVHKQFEPQHLDLDVDLDVDDCVQEIKKG